MTLKEIVARLEAIERRVESANLNPYCEECDSDMAASDDAERFAGELERLRLDIESHLLKTEGTL